MVVQFLDFERAELQINLNLNRSSACGGIMARLPLLNLSSPSSIEIGGGGGLLYSWWNEINESVSWQDGIFYALCAAYALVSSVALVRLRLLLP